MNISYNWLKTYINFDYTVEELSNILTMLGIEIDSYQILKNKYDKFFVGQIEQLETLPNTHLSICKVNINTEILQIVCGANNVALGQKVFVAKEGAVLPINKLRIEKRKLRGSLSEGMICSQSELEFGDDNSGIWILPNNAEIGMSLVEYLDIDDAILEVTLTPNKADCASHLGIAREIAAYTQQKVHATPFFLAESQVKISDYIKIEIEDKELCHRYATRVIKNVKNGKSPAWLRNSLLKIGIRPINLIVDITNYVLMEFGQPLHAFDLDKIADHKIVIKKGFAGYKFTTLDNKERILDENMLMICDAEKPIAIAGVMGGQNSEITDATTTVVLESAYFSPSSVRKTAKKLALATDASYRFERGVDINGVLAAIDRAAMFIAELAGGEVLGEPLELYPHPHEPRIIDLHFEKVRKIIGVDIANANIKAILVSLGFNAIKTTRANITVEVPHRRNDVMYDIDLIEEVARLINYDNIEPNFTSAIDFRKNELPVSLTALPMRNKIRTYLASNGFSEILTYNIIDPASATLFSKNPITIANPLGEEMSKMRPTMITQMLKTIDFNIRQGTNSLKLFETGKVFLPYNNIENSFIDGIDEREHLVMAITGSVAPKQWASADRKVDFYDIKGYIEEMFRFFNIKGYRIKPIDEHDNIFDINSARIIIDKRHIGRVGHISKDISKKYNIDIPVYIVAIDLTELSSIDIMKPKYEHISTYPVMVRDLAFIIDIKHSSYDIIKHIKEKASNLLKTVDVFDVYQGENIKEGKRSIGFSLTFSSIERTLTDGEIEADINSIVDLIETKFEAELRKS